VWSQIGPRLGLLTLRRQEVTRSSVAYQHTQRTVASSGMCPGGHP